ncbi:hypothetical protein M8542_05430 [Amycolatopsis sp. OK19-0408]|uniref:Lipoprotein n=1 Tax=Amycolatopsis iheyensis TaxID=2945988 RepID=A0A9X2SJG2_9PSEU|nr:hypothetical protein [Amycolatopsis iheyensis]MCR6482245.1 hypothetical protein [Amycolatopsis iheyensis]
MRRAAPTIALAALLLTACDPAPGPTPPPSPTLTAPATDTAQLVAAIRTAIAQAPSATFTIDASLGTTGKSSTGALSFDGQTCNLTMTFDGTEIRVLGKKTYTHPRQAAIPGKPWLGTDPDNPDIYAQMAAAAVPLLAELPDLGRALTEIDRAGRIVSANQTTLRDQPANHYRLEIDAARAPDLFPEFAQPPVDGKPAPPVTAKLPAELWLDTADRPARFTIDLSPGFPPAAADAAVKGTTDYRDWGDPVEITAPPADQVADLSELIKKIGA